MATMHPPGIESLPRATEAQKRLFRFIQKNAKPHSAYVAWYAPPIAERDGTPDLVLYCRELGILVMGIAEWTLPQIVSCNPRQFTIHAGGRVSKVPNPDRRVQDQARALEQCLQRISGFSVEDEETPRARKIPVGSIVVFPNISRKEYEASRFKWFIDASRCLMREDMDPRGEPARDPSGRALLGRLAPAMPFPFKGLPEKDLDQLHLLLSPERGLFLPPRRKSRRGRFLHEVRALDDLQARAALRLPRGHQIIKGLAGTGKTLLLVHRCCHLWRYDSRIERILLVCYNIALVGYLRGLLRERGVPTGPGGVEVRHFFELCGLILGEPVRYENEDASYYEEIMKQALSKAASRHRPMPLYDAILVDEGQDFSGPMIQVLLRCLRPRGDLVIALDPCQDVYRRSASWKSMGVRAAGRSRRLKTVYRNTPEIFHFAQCVMGLKAEQEEHPLLAAGDMTDGSPPELRPLGSLEEAEDFLVHDLLRAAEEGYPWSQIGVIYDDKVYGPSRFAYDNRALPMRILQRMEGAGIPTAWISRDVRSKESFDTAQERVSLLSIHSAKGLEFDLVYLLGMDRLRLTAATRRTLIALVYVAVTRARYRLVVPYTQETELLARMKDCLKCS